jgi:hypothetical protein
MRLAATSMPEGRRGQGKGLSGQSSRSSGEDALSLTGARGKRTYLSLPEGLPLEKWVHVGEQILLISNASAWWLGDWLVYGETKYPNRYRDAIAHSSLEYQTLRNYAWVARKFPMSRRQDSLSFQHHFEVAGLPVAEQEVWLQRAKHFGWSKMELRRQVKVRRDGKPDPPPASVKVELAVNQRNRWEEAAKRAGLGLPEWIVAVLERAAEATLTSGSGSADPLGDGSILLATGTPGGTSPPGR